MWFNFLKRKQNSKVFILWHLNWEIKKMFLVREKNPGIFSTRNEILFLLKLSEGLGLHLLGTAEIPWFYCIPKYWFSPGKAIFELEMSKGCQFRCQVQNSLASWKRLAHLEITLEGVIVALAKEILLEQRKFLPPKRDNFYISNIWNILTGKIFCSWPQTKLLLKDGKSEEVGEWKSLDDSAENKFSLKAEFPILILCHKNKCLWGWKAFIE